MPNPNQKTRASQTAYDCTIAVMSLQIAIKELTAIANAPVIEERRLKQLQINLGRANARCAKLANGFDAAGGNG